MANDDRKLLHVRLGPIEVDVPQTVGYFGGIGAALALGLLEPPLAAFIAAVPLVKILADPGSPIPVRLVAEVITGAAKPVGSDAEGTVRIADAARAEQDTDGAERAEKRRSARPSAVAG
jgi:hypothetical protein